MLCAPCPPPAPHVWSLICILIKKKKKKNPRNGSWSQTVNRNRPQTFTAPVVPAVWGGPRGHTGTLQGLISFSFVGIFAGLRWDSLRTTRPTYFRNGCVFFFLFNYSWIISPEWKARARLHFPSSVPSFFQWFEAFRRSQSNFIRLRCSVGANTDSAALPTLLLRGDTSDCEFPGSDLSGTVLLLLTHKHSGMRVEVSAFTWGYLNTSTR